MANTITPHGNANALNDYVPQIIKAANETGLPTWLIAAVIMHESGGKPGAVQPDGQGRGLMQVDGGYHTEAYDPRMTGKSPSDIQFQISTGAAILKDAIASQGGDIEKGLQAYAGSAYRGPGGQTFGQELQASYVQPVTLALVQWGVNHGNFSLANSLKSGVSIASPLIGATLDSKGNPITAIKNTGDSLGQVVGFVSNKDNWLAIAIGVGGFLLIIEIGRAHV